MTEQYTQKSMETEEDVYDEDKDEEGELNFSAYDELERQRRSDDVLERSPEPLFSVLLRRAVNKIDPDDQVLRDYVDYVVPLLSEHLAHKTAKGGNFVIDKRAEGVSEEELKRYGDDQSMRAHLINGLFPVARIANLLYAWGEVPRFQNYFDDDTAYRLFCAGYTLHDWLKLPDVDKDLEQLGLRHDTVNPAKNLSDMEEILTKWCVRLGLDRFLAPLGSPEAVLHALVYIISNTQVLRGTMRNLSVLTNLNPKWQHRADLATDLCTLADCLAYLGRTPVSAARHPAIGTHLQNLSNGTARLTYHHISEVRGVLTNFINNAAKDLYGKANAREAILFAPTGVVYLERKSCAPPAPTLDEAARTTIERIREECRTRLFSNLTGFGRDGKGLKYAPFYDLFFTPRQLAPVVVKAAEKYALRGKSGSAATRYAKMKEKGMVPPGADMDLPTEPTVDLLAEGCAKLEQLLRDYAPGVDGQQRLLDCLELGDIANDVSIIPTLGKMGGVPYQWYYAAGVAHRRVPGRSPGEWVEHLHTVAKGIVNYLMNEIVVSGWDELTTYITSSLRFETTPPGTGVLQAQVSKELEQYSGSGKARRGTVVCSLCSSSYSVKEQRDAGQLFSPQVYTNRQPLHGSKALRHICSICEIEMMLRQVLMNQSAATGGRFEGRKHRFLFFYPTYFFTPETLLVMHEVSLRLRQVPFTKLRQALVPPKESAEDRIDLDPPIFQHLDAFFLDPEPPATESDRMQRLRFSESSPATFGMVGIPPAGRDSKDAEAWIHPAFLSLVLPLLLDVKVVASESMLPLLNEATELSETVFFDSPHQFVTYLTGSNRLNLDQVYNTFPADRRNGAGTSGERPGCGALQRLVAAYLVHMEGNAGTGAGGYDYHWSRMVALARDLETSPLYAFHYLMKGVRQGEIDTLSGKKAAMYIHLVEDYIDVGQGVVKMSHARDLTEMYRYFYRHKRKANQQPNKNTVLRPISEAAYALLNADKRLFSDDESLCEAVQARIEQFLERVGSERADGVVPRWIDYEVRQEKVVEFSHYFVKTIYREVFGGDLAALAGKQLNLLKDTCMSLYLAEERREWKERKVRQQQSGDDGDDTDDTDDGDSNGDTGDF